MNRIIDRRLRVGGVAVACRVHGEARTTRGCPSKLRALQRKSIFFPHAILRNVYTEDTDARRTRDTLLSAVDPNAPPARSAASGTCDPGRVWTGIVTALDGLEPGDRAAIVAKMIKLQASNWKTDPSGSSFPTGDRSVGMTDGALRAANMRDTISEMNLRNRQHWDRVEASRHGL
jgi:hypothetical protein